MEDVLDVYAESPEPKRPVVCFDETPKRLIAEVRAPLSLRPGQMERYDYEYKRNGTRNLLVFLEPNQGWRPLAITATRTMTEFAQLMKWLVHEQFPEAEVICLGWAISIPIARPRCTRLLRPGKRGAF